jgi:hypothetical protein
MLRHQQLIRSFALTGLATAALIAPHAAIARPAADVNGQVSVSHALVDLRSPDAATPVKIAPVQVDLRSPDAATPVHTPSAPTIAQPQTIGTHATSNDDFDFGSAAVGAGIALLVALACFGSMVAVNRRRSPLSLGS